MTNGLRDWFGQQRPGRLARVFAGWAFVLLMSSCAGSATLDQFVQIPQRSWAYDFQPRFEFQVDDTAANQRIYVNFRHTNEYKYSNVFLLLHQKNPSGEIQTKRIELTLAEPDGRWTGKQAGDIYTHRVLVPEIFSFSDTGVFSLSIEQNMRENPLKHVVAAGLRIEAEPSSGQKRNLTNPKISDSAAEIHK